MSNYTPMNKLQSHISFQLCKDVDELCKTLFTHTPIKVFEYSKVYSNGARVELSNHAAHMENAFISRAKMSRVYTPALIPENQRYLLINNWIDSLEDNNTKSTLSDQLNSQHELFGIGNELSIIKRGEEYIEYFHFYANSNNTGMANYYINNIELLEKFALYFTNTGRHLIQQSDKDPLVKPWRKKSSTNDTIIQSPEGQSRDKFIESITPKRFFINIDNRDEFLTKREIDCARLLLKGKTNKQISDELFISLRTVETHLDSLRSKTNSNNRSELIAFLMRTDFVNI